MIHRRILNRFHGENSFERNGMIVLVFGMVGSLVNYLNQVIMGRSLSRGSFGTINALFAAMSFVFVFTGTFIFFVTTRVAKNSDSLSNSTTLSNTLRYLIIFNCAIVILALIFGPLLMTTLDIESDWMLTIIVLIIIFSSFTALPDGTLAGLQKFFILGLIGLAIPLGRLMGTIIAAIIRENDIIQQSIILLGTAVGALIAVIVGYKLLYNFGLRYISKRNRLSDSKGLHFSEYGSMLLINIGLTFYTNIDILFVRLFLGADSAGNYTSVQLLARIVLFISLPFITVLLPTISKQHSENKATFPLLKKMFFYVCLISLLNFPLILFSYHIVSFVFGDDFNGTPLLMLYASLITTALMLINVISRYMMGIGKSKQLALILIINCILSTAMMFLTRLDIEYMLISLALSGFVLFVTCFCFCYYLEKRRTLAP